MAKEKPVIVRIKTAGCDLFPHDSLHEVMPMKEGVYPTLNGRDRISADWCEEFEYGIIDPEMHPTDYEGFFHPNAWTNAYGIEIEKIGHDTININHFRRLGYNSDGSRTGFFKDDEYEQFDKYIKENNLKFEFKQ